MSNSSTTKISQLPTDACDCCGGPILHHEATYITINPRKVSCIRCTKKRRDDREYDTQKKIKFLSKSAQ